MTSVFASLILATTSRNSAGSRLARAGVFGSRTCRCTMAAPAAWASSADGGDLQAASRAREDSSRTESGGAGHGAGNENFGRYHGNLADLAERSASRTRYRRRRTRYLSRAHRRPSARPFRARMRPDRHADRQNPRPAIDAARRAARSRSPTATSGVSWSRRLPGNGGAATRGRPSGSTTARSRCWSRISAASVSDTQRLARKAIFDHGAIQASDVPVVIARNTSC